MLTSFKRSTFTIFSITFMSLTLVLVAGCTLNKKVSDKTLMFADFAKVEELTSQEEERVVILDVRNFEKFQDKHIEGAFNIYTPNIRRREQLLLGEPIIIVYSSGEVRDNLSTAACKRLLNLGYGNVYNYRAGLKDWVKNEGKTEVTELMADLAE
ncbi:rhodanese-like domain-containing protein [Planctomycetota bacterium]|nr:rhodanese-like domain-containing protein [Planctomycetota bacterium]